MFRVSVRDIMKRSSYCQNRYNNLCNHFNDNSAAAATQYHNIAVFTNTIQKKGLYSMLSFYKCSVCVYTERERDPFSYKAVLK